ncbi:MAG TPA: class I SAM-dependent methyltransferase [Firmicutes bacterium]|nr:class I SAM-dependent methyltransferase [Bacillota bacterium]
MNHTVNNDTGGFEKMRQESLLLAPQDACNLCNGNEAILVLELPPHRLVRCRQCGLVFVVPRPLLADAIKIYDEAYFTGQGPLGYKPDENYLGDESRLELFVERMLSIERYRKPPGVMVDVGCASGFSLRAARDRGWDCLGVDVSEFAVNFARERYNLNVFRGTLPDALLPGESVDVVTMWDLIEHVPDARRECVETNRILRPGGLLALATPDADFPDPDPGSREPAKAAFWQADPGEHLQYFSPATICRLLHETGFHVVNLMSFGVGDRRMGSMEVYAIKTQRILPPA